MITNLQSDFSTTNDATLLASQTSIMSAMKHYFKYEVLMRGCGISYSGRFFRRLGKNKN